MTWMDSVREINALVSLMDEPNHHTYAKIHQKIISHGLQAIPILEDSWANTFNSTHSNRLEAAIEDIKFHEAIESIFNWLEDSTMPQTELMHILAAYINNHYDRSVQQNWFEKIYRDCWLEMNEDHTSLEKVNIINHVFYKVHSLSNFLPEANRFEGFFPDYFQNNKKANALMMGLLYLTVAQRLNLPVNGVNLPNHFILAYLDTGYFPMEKGEIKVEKSNIQFYINPSNGGALFTHNEIDAYLQYTKFENQEEFFFPCSRKIMAMRYLSEVHQSLMDEKRITKGTYVYNLIQLLSETPANLGQLIC